MSIRDRVGSLFKGQEELDLTGGRIGMSLFYLSLPIVITNLLQVAYNLADTFWLGQYSTEALAAISLGFPMIYLFISLGMGLTVAGSVLVAQHTGAEQTRKAEFAASQTVSFTFIAAAGLGVVGFLLIRDLLGLFQADPQVIGLAGDYLSVITLGLPFMFGFFVFIALMRGSGDTITPMVVMLGTVVLNIALDPFLIFGWGPFPRMGVEGAAVATVFARGAAMVVGLGIMFQGRRGVRIRLSELTPDLSYGKKLVRVGVPASIENTGRAVSVNAVLFVVTLFSTPVIAAFGVGIRVFSLVFMPAIAIDRGVETMTGQNIGADKPDRVASVNRFAAKVSFLLLAAVGVVIFAFAPTIIALFDNDPAVVEQGATFLRWVAPTFGFVGILRAYSGGLRGAGRTLTAAAIAILMFGIIRLPIAYVASQDILPVDFWIFGARTPKGIWLGFALSSVIAAVLAFAVFESGVWRGVDLTDDDVVDVADDEPGDGTPAGDGTEADPTDD